MNEYRSYSASYHAVRDKATVYRIEPKDAPESYEYKPLFEAMDGERKIEVPGWLCFLAGWVGATALYLGVGVVFP